MFEFSVHSVTKLDEFTAADAIVVTGHDASGKLKFPVSGHERFSIFFKCRLVLNPVKKVTQFSLSFNYFYFQFEH